MIKKSLITLILFAGIMLSMNIAAGAASENYALNATAYATHSRDNADLYKLAYINDGTINRWQTYSTAQNPSIILDLGTDAPIINQVKLAYHDSKYIDNIHSFSVTASDSCTLPSDGTTSDPSIALTGDIVTCVSSQKTSVDSSIYTKDNWNLDANKEIAGFTPIQKRYICISLVTEKDVSGLAEIELYNTNLAIGAAASATTSNENATWHVGISSVNDGTQYRWQAVSTDPNPRVIFDLGEEPPVVDTVKLAYAAAKYIGGFPSFSVTASDYCAGEGNGLNLIGDVVNCVTNQKTSVDSTTFATKDWLLDSNKEIASFTPVQKRYICISLTRETTGDIALAEIELYGNASNAELVQLELDKLDVDTVATEDIYLPKTGDYRSTIVWTSDSSAISADGVVTRESYDGSDKPVTLTATVTRGAVTNKKEFKTTVLKLPMFSFDEVIYKDSDTTYINEYCAIPANNTLVVRGKISKNTGNSEYADNIAGMYVALYDKDGTLVDVDVQTTSEENKQEDGSFLIDCELRIDFVPDGHYIRVHLLDPENITAYGLDEFPKPAAEAGACIYTDPTQETYYENADSTLPNVLVIGDSISQGYRTYLRSDFEAGGEITSNLKANVYYLPQNGGSTLRGLEKLDYWLGNDQMPWKVITFNFGLHDLCYSDYDVENGTITSTVDEYGERLATIVSRLREKYDGTETNLIWINTTHVPAGSAGRIESSEVKYNEKAEEIMTQNDIPIVDLWSIDMAAYEKYENGYHDGATNVHFTADGYRAFANAISPEIATAIIEK